MKFLTLGLLPVLYKTSWKYRLGDSLIDLPPRKHNASGPVKLYTYQALLDHLRIYNFILVRQTSISITLEII